MTNFETIKIDRITNWDILNEIIGQNEQGCIKFTIPPPPPWGKGIISSWWGRNQVGEKGRERGEGKEGREKGRENGREEGKRKG